MREQRVLSANPHCSSLQQTLSLHTSWPFSGKAELCRARAAVRGIRNTAQQKPMNPICSPGSQLAHFLLTPGSPSSNFKLQLQRSCNGHASWPFGVAHEPSRLFQVSVEPFLSRQEVMERPDLPLKAQARDHRDSSPLPCPCKIRSDPHWFPQPEVFACPQPSESNVWLRPCGLNGVITEAR